MISHVPWHLANIFLLGFGYRYEERYKASTKPEIITTTEFGKEPKKEEVGGEFGWREENQKEWDRLSVALALITTAHAATLAISDVEHCSWLVRALWIGGFGLALAGLIGLSYLTIAMFNVTDEHLDLAMGDSANNQQDATSLKLIALVGAMPVALLLWSTMLLILGMFIFVFTVDFAEETSRTVPMRRFRICASVPMFLGVLSVLFMVFVVEKGLRDIKMLVRHKRLQA